MPSSLTQLGGVLSEAFLAFYAFIGFEDMVNVAEEVKNPSCLIIFNLTFADSLDPIL